MRIPYAALDARPASSGNTLRVNFFRGQGARPTASRDVSLMRTGMPASAAEAAMPAPMSPPPTTPSFRIGRASVEALVTPYSRVRDPRGHPVVR